MLEETGLHVDVGPVVEVFDRILLDDEGRVRYHFVLIDYLCTVREAVTLAAGSDVADVTLGGSLGRSRRLPARGEGPGRHRKSCDLRSLPYAA